MSKAQRLFVAYKVFFGLLGLSAIVTEIAVLITRGTFNAGNFFSFFTVENNLLLSLVFLISARYVSAKRTPRWLDALRGASTVYIIIVGVGFVVLLSGLKNVALTVVPWDNIVLHYIMPIAALVDLLGDRPKTMPRFRASLIWLLYPVAYVVYSLVRGAIVGWYPYPFLNPTPKGYGSVAVVSTILLALALTLLWIVCRLPANAALSTKAKR